MDLNQLLEEPARGHTSVASVVSDLPLRENALTSPLELTPTLRTAIEDLVDFSKKSGTSVLDLFVLDGKLLLYSYATLTEPERVARLCNLLDVSLLTSELGHVELLVVHDYLEELLDIQTIDWCQSFWPFFENRESRLAKDLHGLRVPGMNLIRYCNALLRRLSKTQNSTFSGKILLFLAQAFPLDERSALNQRGEFDVDNVTQWDNSDPSSVYSKFWSLQQVFSNPTEIISAPNKQLLFQDTLKTVLDELRKYSSVGPAIDRPALSSTPLADSTTDKEQKNVSEDDEDDDDDRFVPKWLTSPALFELELRDTLFRRVIYSQIYILCDFLLDHQRDSAPKQFPNRWVQYDRTVSPELAKYLKSVLDSFGRGLPSSNPVDLEPTFVRSLKSVVLREVNWTNWKRENAPGFTKPSLPGSEIDKSIADIDAQRGLKRPYRFIMGTPALSRLHAVPTGIERLRNEQRYKVPPPQQYNDSVKEAQATLSETKDPDLQREMTEAISSREWRGLRAARAHGLWVDFHKFDTAKGIKSILEPGEAKVVEPRPQS